MSKIYQNQPLKLLVKGLAEEGETLTTINATTTDLNVMKPDGTTIVTWSGSINADDERFIEYDCVPDVDLDQLGFYKVMAEVDDNLGNGPWPGDTVDFEVFGRFK